MLKIWFSEYKPHLASEQYLNLNVGTNILVGLERHGDSKLTTEHNKSNPTYSAVLSNTVVLIIQLTNLNQKSHIFDYSVFAY